MIKRIQIDNFKSLNNFSMDLDQFTVIVGNNSVGKTSVLDAIDFICNCAKDDFSVILERKNWTVDNIKSKLAFSQARNITFETTIEVVSEDGTVDEVVWKIVLSTNKEKNILSLVSENVVNSMGEQLLEYKAIEKKIRTIEVDGVGVYYAMSRGHSWIKVLGDGDNICWQLKALKQLCLQTVSFELLDPGKMRGESVGKVDTIGISGKDLPLFIRQMNERQRRVFAKKISGILGKEIKEIKPSTNITTGGVSINVVESYDDKNITINARDISDGVLRLLALVALGEIRAGKSAFLLDEVENGFNNEILSNVAEMLRNVCVETGHQLILTSHSTVLMDYIIPESIRYIYRDEKGMSKAVSIFEKKYFKDKLDYMWPGEVMLNLSYADKKQIYSE